MTDKFVSPEMPPEGLPRELLTVLWEECCEVGQRASKALRFGILEVQPGQPLTNAERVSEELGDLMGVMDWLVAQEIIQLDDVQRAREKKHQKLRKYLQSK